jgi:cyclophilin family peptidyl-prolyl cis-trans isomerase
MRNVVLASTRWSLLLLSLLVGAKTTGLAQYTNGIYAEFNTSMGSFTCRLEYASAPKAVANFIGLATGQRAWLDLPSGVVKTNPFYSGTTFHRVIAGFMNQGGSPNGLGTDDPGYAFEDEFSATLRHDSFGVLSSANSGPDSNGSQFFVTAGPTPWLNDVHTVLGKLYGGSNVVYAINHVVTGANDKPLTNIVINNINIQRVGAAAQAFNIHAQGLPVVTNLAIAIRKAANNVSLTFSNRLNTENWLYHTTNLMAWTAGNLGIEALGVSSNTVYRAATLPKEFFRMAQTQYQTTLYVPRTVASKTLSLVFDGGNGTILYSLNSTGTGTYTWTGGAGGNVVGYNWQQDAYRGRFVPMILSGIIPMNLHLDFNSATVGTFKGTALPNYPSDIGSFGVSGTFTSSP